MKPLIAPLAMSKLTLPPAVCTFSITVRPLPARFRSKLPVPLKFGSSPVSAAISGSSASPVARPSSASPGSPPAACTRKLPANVPP